MLMGLTDPKYIFIYLIVQLKDPGTQLILSPDCFNPLGKSVQPQNMSKVKVITKFSQFYLLRKQVMTLFVELCAGKLTQWGKKRHGKCNIYNIIFQHDGISNAIPY